MGAVAQTSPALPGRIPWSIFLGESCRDFRAIPGKNASG
jgi:hypothetical protein